MAGCQDVQLSAMLCVNHSVSYTVFEYLGVKYLDRRSKEMTRHKKVNTVAVG